MWIRLINSCLFVLTVPALVFAQATVEDVRSAIREELTPLRQRVLELEDRVNEQGELMRKLITKDPSGRIDFNMKDPGVRDAFDSAMDQVVRSKVGKMTISNKTGSYQRITVNRVEYSLNPGEAKQLAVPLGTVTTNFAGENPKNWSVGAPDYEQKVDIVPTSAPVTTYYPTTVPVTTYYSPSVPVTTYYSSSVPVTTYYLGSPVYTSPTVTYYYPIDYYVFP